MLTATGLGSGLDINSLVTQLVAAERSGSDLQLNRQSLKLNSKFTALGSLKGAVSSFQTSLGALNNLNNFSRNTATSSNASEVNLIANSSALENNYSIDVTQLAESHALASSPFVDSNETTLGSGTMTIRFGNTDYTSGTDTYNSFTLNPDSSVATIDIDSSNNTLEGVMGAINDADIGVNAAIVNDGTGFRLLMTSETTGENNSLEIAITDDDSNDTDSLGLSRLAFNSSATNLEQTTEAQNALFSINGLAVSSDSNKVTSAIEGVTLILNEVTSSTISASVKQDLNTVKSGVNNFINGYNQFISTANALSAYDVENDVPSALLGDFTLRSINGQINTILRNAVEGLSGDMTNLSELGITTNSDGTLKLEDSTLEAALADDPSKVAKLFAAVGAPDDSSVAFNASNENTVVGSYAVEITTAASAGSFTSASVLPDFGGGASLVIDSDNNNLNFEIDGIETGLITLTAGTYTSGADLANELQAQINGVEALRSSSTTVEVSYDSDNDSFTILSNSIGSSSTVNILSVDTNTVAQLGFDVLSGIDGNDVAGTIDGVTAIGVGNVLTAESGDAEGLSLIIDGIDIGSRGNVNFTRGLSDQLDSLFTNLLDEEGALESRIDTFQDRLKEVESRRAELELRWEAVEERYRRQFNALDSLLAGLQSTSEYLEGQFDNLLQPNTGNN